LVLADELESEENPADWRSLQEKRLRGWVKDYFAFVWRSLRHLGVPPADADDAAQQVFLVAARKVGEIQEGMERSFLFGTAVRIASRSRRTHHRRREVSGDAAEQWIDSRPGPDEQLDRAEGRVLLARILDQLEHDVRAVFVLFEIEQLTMAEIAEALEIPSGTVASRLRRGRERFRSIVERLEKKPKGAGGRS
jgi:RNA polymerase sigma-70 factor (ECF subfamily)